MLVTLPPQVPLFLILDVCGSPSFSSQAQSSHSAPEGMSCQCMCVLCIHSHYSLNVPAKLASCMPICWNKSALRKNEEEKRRGREKKREKGQCMFYTSFFS